MDKKARIKAGGFTVARKLFVSPVWFKDPLYLKLWVWIIGEANHEDVKKNGYEYKRGEIVTTYSNIIKALSYRHNRQKMAPSLKKVRIMLEWLVNEGMIRVESIKANSEKSRKPQLTERCQTGADTGADSRAYLGLKITVINYNTYQDFDNYRGRHRDRNLSEQGHNNNNDINNNEYHNNLSVDVYSFYLTEICPENKTRQRALSNIAGHLKKHSSEALRQAIQNYKASALRREPQYRKDPANFFGKREKYFIDFLPDNFQIDGPQQQSLPQVKNHDNPCQKAWF